MKLYFVNYTIQLQEEGKFSVSFSLLVVLVLLFRFFAPKSMFRDMGRGESSSRGSKKLSRHAIRLPWEDDQKFPFPFLETE